MTVLDASTKLFLWFQKNNTFCLQSDEKEVVLISEDRERDRASLLAGLENLCENGICRYKKVDDKEYWILSKPFDSIESNVELGAPLASAIAEEINQFCDIIDDHTDQADPTAINEKDIRNFVFIYNHYKQMANNESPKE